MHVLVLGGTGPSGIKLIEEALSASHTVVVYARSPQKLPDAITSNPSVTVVEGQLSDADALEKAMQGVHAVVSALGPGAFHPSDTPLAKAYGLLIDLMKKNNVQRLILLGTASIKDENDKFSLQFAALISGVAVLAHSAYKDIVAIGTTVRASDLVWTIARVPILTNKEEKDYIAGYVGDGKTRTTLSRAAFAHFVIHELEVNEWCKKAPLISSP
ncbi:NAD(P)-binding protein [Obba rivulosa]|uniref:NAD(P)-binding protein n=1 Tax=Obba rivulosa TaxID=1052685 RepID=A0A8E2J3Y0_9APHY|nr:NAD(P)-binding protein [Obba rivulosa]